MNNNITIGGVQHPLFFNFNAIRNIMAHSGMESFADLQKNVDVAKTMDLALTCAFYAIAEGYDMKGEQSPFATEIEIARKVQKYTELLPAINGFTSAITDFFATDDDGSKKPKP
jgi:hypothetical protein